MMYFEIYDWDTLIKRGKGEDILNEIEWENELMTVPSLTLTLPISYAEYIKGREEFKLWVNGKVFWGIVKDHNLNKADETLELQIEHVVSEWEYRQISVNHAIQDNDLNIVYKGAKTVKKNGEAITASNFTIQQDVFDKASNAQLIEYAYARAWNESNGDKVSIVNVSSKLVEDSGSKDITSANAIGDSGKGNAVVEYAKKFLGTPYVLGGNSLTKGCDCSGFTKGVFAHFGIDIPRYSQDQLSVGKHISKENIQPGDLIVYYGHVAIYIGNNRIIHSTTDRIKGTNHGGVQIKKHPFYRKVAGIRRLVNSSADKGSARDYSEAGYGSKKLIGHEVPALFTAYYPSNSTMEGGFYDAQGHRLYAKNMTCAAPPEIPFGTYIQITEFKPKYGGYLGNIYKVTDRGGAIQVVDGVYHIDILVGSAKTADKFGKRTGKIIIGDKKPTYKYEGNSGSTSSSSRKYEVTFKTAKGTEVTVEMTIGDEYKTESAQDASVIDNIGDILGDYNFAYPGWTVDFQDDSAGRMIDYVYSRQNKLEALTKTIELTPDLFWRVGFTNEKKIEIGKFGKQKNHIISVKPQGRNNSMILTEPTVDWDYENVVNVATVYSEKSDTGMASMTLREVYNDPSLQDKDFPVVILRANANNERDYSKYVEQYPKLAPNNELEYAILDTESIALEAGYLIEGTYAFTDLAPTNIEGKKITDKQRIKAAQTAYHAAIRRLKESRRTYTCDLEVTELPADINVGDKVRFIYDNKIWNLDACTNYWKKILTYDDWFYVQKIGYTIHGDLSEVNSIVLTKYLKVEREGNNQ